MAGYRTLQQEYYDMPPITRAYTTSCVLTTIAVQLEILTPFQLYFNPDLIFYRYQFWRLVTNFLFFGTIGFNFFFNMIFIYRYCRMLEEGSFRNRTADFMYMFIFGATLMSIMALFINMVFLGHAFTIMLVYVWGRRNPYIRLNFFGLVTFQAPLLSWVLFAFSLLLGNSILVDIMGIAVGHIYYFLEDVFPEQAGGFRILKTPPVLKWLLDPIPDEENFEDIVELADDEVITPSHNADPYHPSWNSEGEAVGEPSSSRGNGNPEETSPADEFTEDKDLSNHVSNDSTPKDAPYVEREGIGDTNRNMSAERFENADIKKHHPNPKSILNTNNNDELLSHDKINEKNEDNQYSGLSSIHRRRFESDDE